MIPSSLTRSRSEVYGFSSCTFLHKWLSITFEWVFVMYTFVRMTIHFLVNGFLSRLFLYEWLSISFEWFFVMYMFVRMTIHFLVNWFSSCTFLYECLSISLCIGFRHVHVCKNDYPIPCVWIVVIYISVQMTTFSFWLDFRQCTFLYGWLPLMK